MAEVELPLTLSGIAPQLVTTETVTAGPSDQIQVNN